MAIGFFLDRLEPASWLALLAALTFYLARIGAATRAWRNIVAAAYPDVNVRWRGIFGATTAGMAASTFVPAKGGDLLRLFLVHRQIAGATYPTLAATLVVETVFPFLASTAFLVWALQAGEVPGWRLMPDLGAFDQAAANPLPTALASAALVAGAALLALRAGPALRAARRRFAQGFAALGHPRVYLLSVAPWQALDWLFRLLALYWFLRAFGLAADLHNALAVQVAQNTSALLPVTPSGLGTEQALIVSNLLGEASAGDAIGFSVGMKLSLVTVNLVVGLTALVLMAGTLRWRQLLASETGALRRRK